MAEPKVAPSLAGEQANLNSVNGEFFSDNKHSLESMEACFAAFDHDGDGFLNLSEFTGLCGALFRDDTDKPYSIEGKRLQEMLDVFDANGDGLIDLKEFELCWQKWIKTIIRPVTALIIVDVQNDFISGTLAMSNCPAKQNGEEVVEPINLLQATAGFDCILYSLDWHPENHVSFADNVALRKLHESSEIQNPEKVQVYDTVVFEGIEGSPPIEQRLWPRHCVQNSWGSKLHENLEVVEGGKFIYKGTNPEIDSYSAFWDNLKLSETNLNKELQSAGVTDCYICGVAYDICVGYTSLHACEHGYRVALIDDASRGTSFEDINAMKGKLKKMHALIVKADEVQSLVQARDRRPEWGYSLALRLRNERKKESTG